MLHQKNVYVEEYKLTNDAVLLQTRIKPNNIWVTCQQIVKIPLTFLILKFIEIDRFDDTVFLIFECQWVRMVPVKIAKHLAIFTLEK